MTLEEYEAGYLSNGYIVYILASFLNYANAIDN
jgi:hypothetical protein